MKRKGSVFPRLQTADTQRSRLDVNLGLVLAIGITITIIIYGTMLPLRTSFVGILLYERGLTQYLVVWLASIVITFTIIKWFKISQELSSFRKIWISEGVIFDNPRSPEVINFQKNLLRDNSLLALRCSRVVAAYIQSESRQSATEFALDDSSFYLSNSESSYAFPRILVWAIPLLGFIGTVLGISQAVSGFSGFLETAGEVEQIRTGIGTVTSGLAVAFDTTLLALLLSVLVMIPLVLVERKESRLLLRIEMYINDYLLPRFKEEKNNLNETTINKAVERVVKTHFPSPEQLIEPAHDYATKAVQSLTDVFVSELLKVQNINENLIDKIDKISQVSSQDREIFIKSWESQQEANQDLIAKVEIMIDKFQGSYRELSELQQELHQGLLSKIDNLLNNLQRNYQELSQGLTEQTQAITKQLEQASILLENRLNSLEIATDKFQEITQLKQSIDAMILSLEKFSQVETTIISVREQIQQLKPSLDKLSKPRVIKFLDYDE